MPSYNEEEKLWFWDKVDDDHPDAGRICSLRKGEGNFFCKSSTCGSPTHSNSLSTKSMILNQTWTSSLTEYEDAKNDDLIAFDYSNFNNLGMAMVTIFVMITLEGWSGLMYNLSDASTAWMAIIFCLLLVIVGSFFLLNVILAVIMDSFTEANDTKKHEKLEQEKRKLLKAQKRKCGIDTSDDEDDSDRRPVLEDAEPSEDEADKNISLNPFSLPTKNIN